jgi:hypothetical protein
MFARNALRTACRALDDQGLAQVSWHRNYINEAMCPVLLCRCRCSISSSCWTAWMHLQHRWRRLTIAAAPAPPSLRCDAAGTQERHTTYPQSFSCYVRQRAATCHPIHGHICSSLASGHLAVQLHSLLPNVAELLVFAVAVTSSL